MTAGTCPHGKEYELITSMIIECKDEDRAAIIDELMGATIAIVERYKGYCGGGFMLIDIN